MQLIATIKRRYFKILQNTKKKVNRVKYFNYLAVDCQCTKSKVPRHATYTQIRNIVYT